MDQDENVRHENQEFRLARERLAVLAAASVDVLPEGRLANLIRLQAVELLRGAGVRFDFEEAGGYMADVIAERPDLVRRVDAAFGDHGDIRVALVALIDSAAKDDTPVVQEHARVLLRQLRAHEEREVDLHQESTDRDLRGGN